MRRVSVPGKAMLAGEYAVLLPGEPCLVTGVERRLFVEGEPSDRWEAVSGEARWVDGDPPLPELTFVAAAVQAVRARYEGPPLRLRTFDELRDGELKLGLGGSAAVTVAATWMAAPEDASADQLWAIADEVHRSQQGGKGSGADVAASVHGGVLRYVREPRTASLVKVHPDVRLMLVWTGRSARTAPRLGRFDDLARQHPGRIQTFARISREAVQALEAGLVAGDQALIRAGVGQARAGLRGLEDLSGLELETTALRLAADVAWEAGVAGKLSGAGGGDCAVVLAVGDEAAARAMGALSQAGLRVIPVEVAATGVRQDGT